jgi:hypothetical protein
MNILPLRKIVWSQQNFRFDIQYQSCELLSLQGIAVIHLLTFIFNIPELHFPRFTYLFRIISGANIKWLVFIVETEYIL